MWKEERDAKDLKQKQSFVDLGCGNGLLVHILSEEGVTIDITVMVLSGSLQPYIVLILHTLSIQICTQYWGICYYFI